MSRLSSIGNDRISLKRELERLISIFEKIGSIKGMLVDFENKDRYPEIPVKLLTPISKIDYNELLTGDKDAILLAARILGYGADYEFEYQGEHIAVDLAEVEDKQLDESIKPQAHSDLIKELPNTYGNDVDIMVEAKHKELAIEGFIK